MKVRENKEIAKIGKAASKSSNYRVYAPPSIYSNGSSGSNKSSSPAKRSSK